MTAEIKPTADVYELAAQEFTLDYVAIHAAADVVFAAGYAKGHSDAYDAGAEDGAQMERARIVATLRGPGIGLGGAGLADLIDGGEI